MRGVSVIREWRARCEERGVGREESARSGWVYVECVNILTDL